MRVDLNQLTGTVEGLLPWDLSLTVDGTDYPTKRPTVATIVSLESGSKGDQFEAVRNIFSGRGPDIGGWTGELIAAAVTTYLMYFNQQVQKNSPALIARTRQMLAAATVGATPTPGA